MSSVSSFVVLVQRLGAGAMTRPSLASLVTLLTGWVFAGRHTVTGMVVAAGAVRRKHHSAYHRLFATARWSLDALGLALFELLRPLLAEGPVALTLDDTLARKRGRTTRRAPAGAAPTAADPSWVCSCSRGSARRTPWSASTYTPTPPTAGRAC